MGGQRRLDGPLMLGGLEVGGEGMLKGKKKAQRKEEMPPLAFHLSQVPPIGRNYRKLAAKEELLCRVQALAIN